MYETAHAHVMAKDSPLPFALPEWIALAPFEEYLGMRIDETADGKAVLSMPFRATHCQGAGLMHGGAVVALADTALAIAIKTLLPEGTHFATIKMELSVLCAGAMGYLTSSCFGTRKKREGHYRRG